MPPLTAAERTRRRRDKLKSEGKYEEHRAKIRESTNKSRAKKKRLMEDLSDSKKKKIQLNERRKVRERVAKHRLLKKLCSSVRINHILDMTPKFYVHSYVKRVQADAYNKDRLASSSDKHDPSVALVHVDFSENFTCIAQDEVQSYHWVQPQVTLFTVSMWVYGKQQPIVIVSDNRNHNKDTVVIYMDKILQQLPENVTKVHVWSDGPSPQFKNKFIAASLEILEKRNNKNIIWKYFATSHGKGPVDGIGGALKRLMRNRIIRREAIITNAEQFTQTAKDSTVKVINVTPEEIIETSKEIDLDNIFAQAKPISGISKMHVMFRKNGNLITAHTAEEVNVGIRVRLSMYEQVYGSDSSDDDTPLSQLKLN